MASIPAGGLRAQPSRTRLPRGWPDRACYFASTTSITNHSVALPGIAGGLP